MEKIILGMLLCPSLFVQTNYHQRVGVSFSPSRGCQFSDVFAHLDLSPLHPGASGPPEVTIITIIMVIIYTIITTVMIT